MVESIPKKSSFNEFSQDDNGTLSIGRLTGIPNINSPQPPGNISTWFMGTRAENGPLFKELIDKAVDHIIQYRQDYLPIVSQSLFNTKLFCRRLLLMAGEHDNFIPVPLPRLPIERTGGDRDR